MGKHLLLSFAGQFGLGGEFSLEFWYEIEDYAVMDHWDKVIAADPQKYGQVFEEFAE